MTKEKKEMALVPTEINSSNLKMQMRDEANKRKLITAYISHHMKDKVDFGKIHVKRDCPNPYTCNNEYHFSKPSLFKPGAEKFASLFKLRAAWKKDNDTWEMLGSLPGTVCYICELFTSKGELVGEGRGASSVEEKKNANIAIKIAKKRAFVDAILATGALSDFFTQDLEDMGDFDKSPVKANAKVVVSGTDTDEEDVQVVAEPKIPTDKMQQRQVIVKMIQMLDKKVDIKDKKEIERFIAEKTELALTEANFPSIIEALNEQLYQRM